MDENTAAAVARQTLATELGCSPEAISVIGSEPAEWRDSSLGCPQPGMMYMQVITPGFRITLEHNGWHYILHTDQGRRAVRCTNPDADSSPFAF